MTEPGELRSCFEATCVSLWLHFLCCCLAGQEVLFQMALLLQMQQFFPSGYFFPDPHNNSLSHFLQGLRHSFLLMWSICSSWFQQQFNVVLQEKQIKKINKNTEEGGCLQDNACLCIVRSAQDFPDFPFQTYNIFWTIDRRDRSCTKNHSVINTTIISLKV